MKPKEAAIKLRKVRDYLIKADEATDTLARLHLYSRCVFESVSVLQSIQSGDLSLTGPARDKTRGLAEHLTTYAARAMERDTRAYPVLPAPPHTGVPLKEGPNRPRTIEDDIDAAWQAYEKERGSE